MSLKIICKQVLNIRFPLHLLNLSINIISNSFSSIEKEEAEIVKAIIRAIEVNPGLAGSIINQA